MSRAGSDFFFFLIDQDVNCKIIKGLGPSLEILAHVDLYRDAWLYKQGSNIEQYLLGYTNKGYINIHLIYCQADDNGCLA